MKKLKIYAQSMSGSNYTQVPTILLKGKWIDERGFNMGDYVAAEFVDDIIFYPRQRSQSLRSFKSPLRRKSMDWKKTTQGT